MFLRELLGQCSGNERREDSFHSPRRLHQFTIGPKADKPECLLKYARLLSAHDQLSNHVKDLVQGVIEGETRVLAASMTMEQIFKGTKEFRKQVFDHVQLELDQFGLLVYNANVKQLVYVPGHKYFLY